MKKVASSYVSLEKSTIGIYDRKMVGKKKKKKSMDDIKLLFGESLKPPKKMMGLET